MTLLEELTTILTALDCPVETGVFKDTAPDVYAVLVPLADSFKLYADDAPNLDLQEVRISIYSKGSYTTLKNAVVRALLRADISVTARQYIGYETDTGYFHYNVDAARVYEMEES